MAEITMDELGIVFNHHDTSPTARQNLEALRRLNPEGRVFTVSAHEPFEGGFRVGDLGEGGRVWESLTSGDKKLEWRNCDWLVYAWILGAPTRCRRWLFVGWDVHTTMPVREFLGDTWNKDAAAVEVFRPERHPGWAWFRDGAPDALSEYICGVCPVCFFFCSDECARAIAAHALEHRGWDGFCELRLGTFIRASGFEPTVIEGARKTISWRWEKGWRIEGRGIWHPVKKVVAT